MKNGLKQYPANLLYWGGPQSVKSGRGFRPLLFDRFLTDRSAGAINGTAAEPGGSDAPTRVVSDTGNKATVSDDVFKAASGGSTNTPNLTYNKSYARAAGRVVAAKCYMGQAAGDFQVSKDFGTFANLTTLPTVTPAGSGQVKVTLSAAEMQAANVTVKYHDPDGTWDDGMIVIQPLQLQLKFSEYIPI